MASLASGREWGINAVMMNAGRRIDFLFTAWRRTLGIPRRRRVSLFFCFERNDNNKKKRVRTGLGQRAVAKPSPIRARDQRPTIKTLGDQSEGSTGVLAVRRKGAQQGASESAGSASHR